MVDEIRIAIYTVALLVLIGIAIFTLT